MTDYYSILGVNKGASSSDIKKGYFKQSKLYHPDKNKNANAKEQFQKINEAYEVLQDPNKKKIYDQFGKEGLETMGGGTSMGHPFEHVFNFGPGGPSGGGFEIPGFGFVQFGNQRGSSQPKSPNVDAHLSITLEEAFTGTTKELRLMRKIYNKAKDKIEERPLKFKIEVPAGSQEKVQQVLRGKGHQYKNHLPGDLALTISIKPHSVYKFNNHNLVYEKKLTLAEALVGLKYEIPGLDGNKIIVDESGNIKDEDIKVLPRQGYINNGRRQDLIIKYNIKYPTELTLKQVNELKKIFGYTTVEAIGHKTHKANIRRGGQQGQQQAQECVHQ
jgi:DnaJ family protein B protein 4